MWNNKTGLPERWAAVWASANDACHRTRPGGTRGLSALPEDGRTEACTGFVGGRERLGCERAVTTVAATAKPVVNQTTERNSVGNMDTPAASGKFGLLNEITARDPFR